MTNGVRIHAPFDPRWREYKRAIRARDEPGITRPWALSQHSRRLSHSARTNEETYRLILRFEETYARTYVQLGIMPTRPPTWRLWPTHLRASHASSDLRCRPSGWWKISAVFMLHGCEYFWDSDVDPIRVNGPAGLWKALSMCEDASARQRGCYEDER